MFALLKDVDKRVENWLDIAERGFNFATKAVRVMKKAVSSNNADMKKEVFTGIGSNYLLDRGKLRISLDDLLLPLENIHDELWLISEMLELSKKQGTIKDSGEIYSKNPRFDVYPF